MDERIEAFLKDVMAFECEDSNVRQRLAVYEKQFCAAETDKRMKDMAFRAFYVLARSPRGRGNKAMQRNFDSRTLKDSAQRD
jgi:hypothetical protein